MQFMTENLLRAITMRSSVNRPLQPQRLQGYLWDPESGGRTDPRTFLICIVVVSRYTKTRRTKCIFRASYHKTSY